MSHSLAFAKQLLRNPREIMAIAPSSRALCDLMAAQCDGATGPIAELGAGTGKITESLLNKGFAPQKLHLIELNEEFCDLLTQKFPATNVHHGGAQDIVSFVDSKVDFVVSGLPLLGFSYELQHAIIDGISKALAPGGAFIQFTYGPKPPVRKKIREEYNMTSQRIGGVLFNAPPASVYRFTFDS